jgi:hypothetical protein
MKFISKITVILFVFTITSCQPLYYQVYNTKNNNNIQIKKDVLVYEDSNCAIIYDLWADGGNFSFKFINKTDNNVYIHLDESFYVKNGMAYNFYNNRIFSNTSFSFSSNSTSISSSIARTSNSSFSKSRSVTGYNAYDLLQTNKLSKTNNFGISNTFGVSNTFTSTVGNSSSTTQIEEKIMIIPKKSAKIIYGFYINNGLFNISGLTRLPKKNEKSSIQFTKESSPLNFSNLISYSLNKEDKLIKIDNEFYVSEITNYDSKAIIEIINKDEKGKAIRPRRYLRDSAPNKFYIKYNSFHK